MKKIITITSIALVLLSGCSSNSDTSSDKIKVMTSYYPYALVAEEIGGDLIDVESIYPIDSDAHSYEITPQQTMDLQDADLIIITNDEEDSAIYNSLKDNDNILSVVEEHDDEDHDDEDHDDEDHDDEDHDDEDHDDEDHDDEDHDDEDHDHDSHSWLSPTQMSFAVDAISQALVDLDEENKLVYTTSASEIENQLTIVSDKYETFGKEQTKPIIATHDAYNALTEDYGIEFVTLYGAHHDDEPTTKEIIDTVDLIKDKSIKTIFVEQDDPSNKVMRQLADETAVNVDTLYTLESESSSKSFNSIIDFYNYNLKMFEEGQK